MNPPEKPCESCSPAAAGATAESRLREVLEPSPEAVRRIAHAALTLPAGTRRSTTAPGLVAAALGLVLVAGALLFPHRPAGPPELDASVAIPSRFGVTVLGTGSSIVIAPAPRSLRAAEPADETAAAGGSILLIRRRSS